MPDPMMAPAIDGQYIDDLFGTSNGQPTPLRDKVRNAATKYGIPVDMAMRQVQQESGWDPNRIGSAGEIGLFQILPSTAKSLGIDPHNIDQNIDGAMRYLLGYYHEFRDWRKALAAYNAGPTAVRNGKIPQSTMAYVNAIMGAAAAGPQIDASAVDNILSGKPSGPSRLKPATKPVGTPVPPRSATPEGQAETARRVARIRAQEGKPAPTGILGAAEDVIGRAIDRTPAVSRGLDVGLKALDTPIPDWLGGVTGLWSEEQAGTVGELLRNLPPIVPGLPGSAGESFIPRAPRGPRGGPATIAEVAPVRTGAASTLPMRNARQMELPLTQERALNLRSPERPDLHVPGQQPLGLTVTEPTFPPNLLIRPTSSLGARTTAEFNSGRAADEARAAVSPSAPQTATSVTSDILDHVRRLLHEETGGIRLGDLIGEINLADKSLKRVTAELGEQANMLVLRADLWRTIGRKVLSLPQIDAMGKLSSVEQRAIRDYFEDRTLHVDGVWQDIVHRDLDPFRQRLSENAAYLRSKMDPEQYAALHFDDSHVPRLAEQYGTKPVRKGPLAQTASSTKPYTYARATNPATGESHVVYVGEKTLQKWDNKQSSVLGTFEHRPSVGDKWVDKEGNSWNIEKATAKDVETHTYQTYYPNVARTVVLKWMESEQVREAVDWLDSLKNNPEFLQNAINTAESSPRDINPAWVSPHLPQFRGWVMEPKMAAVLNQYDKAMRFGDFNMLQKLSHTLTNMMYWIPTIHGPNVSGLLLDATAQNLNQIHRFAPDLVGLVRDMTRESPLWRGYIAEGFRSLYTEARNREFWDATFRSMDQEMLENPTLLQKMAQSWHTDIQTAKNWLPMYLARNATPMMDDVYRLSLVRALEREGWSIPNAIREAHRWAPDYRQPAALNLGAVGEALNRAGAALHPGLARAGDWAGIGLAKFLSDTGLFMFQAYHTAILKGMRNMTLTPGTTIGQRVMAARRLAALGFSYFIVKPMVDKAVQKITNNPRAGVRATAGYWNPIEQARRVMEGEQDLKQVAMAFFTPVVWAQAAASVMSGKDVFTGKSLWSPGAGPGEQALGAAGELGEAFTPISDVSRGLSRQNPLASIGSKFGITAPKMTGAEAGFLITGKDRAKWVEQKMRQLPYDQATSLYAKEIEALTSRALHMLQDEANRGMDGVPTDPNAQRTVAMILAQHMLKPPTGKQLTPAPSGQGGLPWNLP